MRPVRIAVAALAGLGMLGVVGWSVATQWAPDRARYPLQGIDLGEEPGPVEWGTLRARGADFAYLAATSGADRRVASFEANWDALPAAGLRRGAVLLYSLCQAAAAQANAFNAVVPRAADALPAAIDVRFSDDCTARPPRDALVADLATLVAIVETHTGKPVLLRISRGVERAYALTRAIDRPVWATGNFIAPDYAARRWRMWRASDVRRVEGIDGPVDWDVVAP